MDILCIWTGQDKTVGQVETVGCPMDVPHPMDVQWKSHGCPLDRWTGQDSGTSLVCEGGMSNGCPVDVHWTGGLDRTVGQAWSVRGGVSHGRSLDRWTGPDSGTSLISQ